MKKILQIILLAGIIGSVFVINEANAAASGTNGVKATIESVMATLISHEQRISSIESKTSTVVANSQAPSALNTLFASAGENHCEVLTTDTEPVTEYVRGWCPDGQYYKYLIEDNRVVSDSLVITNVQNPLSYQEGIATCTVSQTGDFPINGTFTLQNAFLLDCSGNTALTATHTLIYSVFN